VIPQSYGRIPAFFYVASRVPPDMTVSIIIALAV
jgi:hypothetical protein